MALRATSYWKSVMNRIGSRNRSFATAASPSVSKANRWANAMGGEWTPIAVLGGMLLVAAGMGIHTAKQQLVHSPCVRVSKKRRETVPEVEEPERIINSSDKFVKKSFLRKVAHIQEHPRTIPDLVRTDPYTRPREAQTLKAVGVDPGRR
ncbi:uncharacterized protein LOC116195237 isoform X1 [Punica granatum]|uniref:Uncharacterized protein LOC116195237 isoform X1 n=1 Tax=Punica granatum TaxID=22663 RepID=A0A218XZ76_PUNGR|nr:uncharacterized protein LOC116195237 isoform X1 [Punica granatum]OWM89946.1 hypothetical protein CDL15_Pgr012583 [Punica granatum]